MTVSRVEIADCVAIAFIGEPVTRDDLVAFACQFGARAAVLRTLAGLPDGSFRELRQLWPALPDVPIDARRPHR